MRELAAVLHRGELVAGYEIEELVGEGGMGAVYRAREASLGRSVALKVIASRLAGDPSYRERFMREARLAARIEHVNVVPIYGAGEDTGRLFIAMRFIDGIDLESALSEGGLPAPEAARIVASVADALDAAHALGLVHRDVKPANILLDAGGGDAGIYLTDFGVAVERGAQGLLTRDGAWVGTPDYAAPEQIRDAVVDARTDVYALGAVLYHCLTGQPPFPADRGVDPVSAHLGLPPPRPREMLPSLPAQLDEVVTRAMSKDPSQRYPSAGDLGHAALAATLGQPPSRRERSVATGRAAPAAAAATVGRGGQGRELRKTVTVLACQGLVSTASGQPVDPEALQGPIGRWFAEVDAIVERHGGTVQRLLGDAALAAFGAQRVHEDDALRAVRTALELRERLAVLSAELGITLEVRSGVHTGKLVVDAQGTLTAGAALNVAADLQQAAEPGEILLTEATRRLVRDAVRVDAAPPLAVWGGEPLAAHRVVAMNVMPAALARRRDAPLVGRERELALIRGAYDRAVAEQVCMLFSLLGPAGIGKSRLGTEFVDGVADDARILCGRCPHYGEGITFWALAEALTPLGADAAVALEQMAGERGAAAGELSWEVRGLLERAARDSPVVLVIDDLHWAEPALLDLLDDLADLSRSAPLLLLCLARPELLDERPSWGGGKLNATSALLGPLRDEDCHRLLRALDPGVAQAVVDRITTASGGSPLFAEEMLSLARELGHVAVPSTIEALLAARIEQLAPGERETLELAAVEGLVFHGDGVRALAPPSVLGEIDTHLRALVRKDLIRPTAPGEGDGYRFHHLLLRDAAYDELPKRRRAELHERFADWMSERTRPVIELDEVVGWHLEQAVRLRRELALAPQGDAASRAADHLAAAGRRAANRADAAAADSLMTRALALMDAGDPRRPMLAVDLAEVLAERGGLEHIGELLAEASNDPHAAPHATAVGLLHLDRIDPDAALAEAETQLPAALAAFQRSSDQPGLARAYQAMSLIEWLRGRVEAAMEANSRAAEHARRAGNRGLLVRTTLQLAQGLVIGPANPEIMRRNALAIERSDLGPFGETALKIIHRMIALLEGDLEGARTLQAEATATWRELGHEIDAIAATQQAADIEIAAGRPHEAARLLRSACDELERLGERTYRSTCAAQLAEAHYLSGDLASAERVEREARAESSADDLLNFIILDALQARLQLSRGDVGGATRMARSAVAHAFATGLHLRQAAALVTLAEVLHAAGNRAEARTAMSRAIAHYETKGDRIGTAGARALATSLGLTP